MFLIILCVSFLSVIIILFFAFLSVIVALDVIEELFLAAEVGSFVLFRSTFRNFSIVMTADFVVVPISQIMTSFIVATISLIMMSFMVALISEMMMSFMVVRISQIMMSLLWSHFVFILLCQKPTFDKVIRPSLSDVSYLLLPIFCWWAV